MGLGARSGFIPELKKITDRGNRIYVDEAHSNILFTPAIAKDISRT
jgi:hypothetical protein